MKSEMEKLREKQMRRRRKRTLRILAISPLIALAFVAGLSLLTAIGTVIVRNPTVYSASEISEVFSFSVGDSLFSVDRDKLEQQLITSRPYVKTAEVHYGFPNRLEVNLTAAEVAYYLPTEEGILLLDDEFKVLDTVSEPPTTGLLIQGMEIGSYTVGYPLNEEENLQVGVLRSLTENLKTNGLYDRVSYLDLSKKHNISMKIYDVIEVELGNSENLSDKFHMLVNVLSENDVTVPAQISVRDYTTGRYSRLPEAESGNSTDVSSDSVSTENQDEKPSTDRGNDENS